GRKPRAVDRGGKVVYIHVYVHVCTCMQLEKYTWGKLEVL
uniref:Uncharacterized protein n=1 Tax=Amphimedon queenslandica TaxID=400682 RepID=A0A1X7SYL8_AMPQE